jgi:hypothetical protein
MGLVHRKTDGLEDTIFTTRSCSYDQDSLLIMSTGNVFVNFDNKPISIMLATGPSIDIQMVKLLSLP